MMPLLTGRLFVRLPINKHHFRAKIAWPLSRLAASTRRNYFGVIAAVSLNNVIGIDGKLPWNIPEDRELFKQTTLNNILIIGRNTLYECHDCDNPLAHVCHASDCIVVSRSVKSADVSVLLNESIAKGHDSINLHIAASFDQALSIAKQVLVQNDFDDPRCIDTEPNANHQHHSYRHQVSTTTTNNRIWVAGGSGLYKEALAHDKVDELRLSVVQTNVNISGASNVAYFPKMETWLHQFRLVKAQRYNTSPPANSLSFIHYHYTKMVY